MVLGGGLALFETGRKLNFAPHLKQHMLSHWKNNNNMHRWTAAAADSALHITDLPIGFLVDVASYLAKPSRALFAVAMTDTSTMQHNIWVHVTKLSKRKQSETSRAIVSSTDWQELDFEDIEKELAAKLSDDNVCSVLQCINAKEDLNRLKLAGCVNITGRGLNPLRESTAIQLLDISTIGRHEMLKNLRKRTENEPKRPTMIDEVVVRPLLDSILNTNDCSLKYIHLPGRSFHNEENGLFDNFTERYKQHFDNCGYNCSWCDENMNGVNWISSDLYQSNVCYDCLQPFCDDCEDENGDKVLQWCQYCRRDFCTDCVSMLDLDCNEGHVICQGCGDRCEGCGATWCGCYTLDKCIDCKKKFCDGCYSEKSGVYKGHFSGMRGGAKICEECAENNEGCVDDDEFRYTDIQGCEFLQYHFT